MASDGVVEIEVVLDDGSARKAFLRLRKDADDFKKGVEDGVGKGTEKATEGATKGLKGFSEQFQSLIAVGTRAAGVAAGVAALGAAFFSASQASARIVDELQAINSQFDNLAGRGGASAQSLRDSFAETARGLVDLDDVLKASNQTLAALEISASTLTDNFRIARQATVAFGVDTVQAYEALNQSIITGQTRQLRQLGLFIDSKAAIDEYAKSIGVASQFLSEQGRQQAIANAIAAQSAKVFDGVSETQERNSDAGRRLSVSFGELKEAVAAFINTSSGQAAADSINFLARAVDRVTQLLNPGATTTASQLRDVTTEIQNVTQAIDELQRKQAEAALFPNVQGAIQKDIDLYKSKLQELRDEEEKLGMAQMRRAQATQIATAESSKASQQAQADMVQRQALMAQQQSLESQRLQMQMANAQTRMQMAQTEAEFEAAKEQQLTIMKRQQEIERSNIRAQYAAAGLANSQVEKDALLAVEQKYQAQQIALQEQTNASMQRLRGIVQAGIVNGLTNAFAGLGKALVKGQNGFEAFGKAVLSALGSMAIQIGTMLVSIGLGFQALGPVLPVFGLSGAAAVAAGLGLIVLGGALSALGEGGETAAGTASAGGGVTGAGGTANLGAVADGTQLERPQQGQQISVNVQGNILDRRQTGLELVEVIREQFDTQGGQTIVGLA